MRHHRFHAGAASYGNDLVNANTAVDKISADQDFNGAAATQVLASASDLSTQAEQLSSEVAGFVANVRAA